MKIEIGGLKIIEAEAVKLLPQSWKVYEKIGIICLSHLYITIF